MSRVIAVLFAVISLAVTACATMPSRTYTFNIDAKELQGVKRFNVMPTFHKGYRNVFLVANTYYGENVYLRKIVKQGMRDSYARAYVQKGLDDIRKAWLKNEIQGSLAEHTVAYFHRAISTDAGKGKYTKRYESYPHESKDMTGRALMAAADSVQPFPQFLAHNFEGDDFDFSIALTTVYETARDICKWNREQFCRQLYREFQRYQVVSFAVQEMTGKRLLNAIIMYNKQMNQATLVPFDPQLYRSKLARAIVDSGSHLSYVEGRRGSTASKKRVMWFFNSRLSFYRGAF